MDKKRNESYRDSTNNVLDKIKNGSVSYPLVNKKLNIRKAKIHKNVSLFYKEDNENSRIFLITFFNNRMNPKTLKKLLS